MNHRCQFVTGGRGSPDKEPDYDVCDAPASIKAFDRWLCAEHYDFIVENVVKTVSQPSLD